MIVRIVKFTPELEAMLLDLSKHIVSSWVNGRIKDIEWFLIKDKNYVYGSFNSIGNYHFSSLPEINDKWFKPLETLAESTDTIELIEKSLNDFGIAISENIFEENKTKMLDFFNTFDGNFNIYTRIKVTGKNALEV